LQLRRSLLQDLHWPVPDTVAAAVAARPAPALTETWVLQAWPELAG